MKINLIILMITSLFICLACGDKEKDCHKTITFKNATADTLYVVSSYRYPDTLTFVGIPDPILDPNFTMVLPNEDNTQVLWSSDCIESAFESLIPSRTLMIYVFDAKVLEENSWETVKTNYIVLKRYDLSLADLESLNWSIIYESK
jgi:hypothetical protein